MRQCSVAPMKRKQLERLCRYITRPSIANERLKRNRAGHVVLQLKSPWRDGTTRIVMSPLELMQRLAALVPRPRLHLVRFHGVLAYGLNRRWRVAHCVAGPSALIGASNFFELAVATAVSLFCFQSGAALATVVGVLIEVLVMLSVAAIVNATRQWYEHRLGVTDA